MGFDPRDIAAIRKPAVSRVKLNPVTADPARQPQIVLTLPYPPSLNNMYATVRGRRVLSRDGRAFKARVESMRFSNHVLPYAGEVSVKLMFFRPAKRGDLDNMQKATLDALTGVAYADDRQVKRIEAERTEDPSDPRVLVIVKPWEETP